MTNWESTHSDKGMVFCFVFLKSSALKRSAKLLKLSFFSVARGNGTASGKKAVPKHFPSATFEILFSVKDVEGVNSVLFYKQVESDEMVTTKRFFVGTGRIGKLTEETCPFECAGCACRCFCILAGYESSTKGKKQTRYWL